MSKILIHSIAEINWFEDYEEERGEAIRRLLQGKAKLETAIARIDNQIEVLIA